MSNWYYTIFMDENTVFQGPSSSNQVPASPTSMSGVSPRETVAPPSGVPQGYDSSSGGRPSFHPATIIKIVIGLGVIALILFFIFAIVLPLFSKKTIGNAEIKYWGLWEDKGTIQPIIDDFNKKYPNIKVNYVKQDIKQYREKLSTQISNNTGPDVYLFHNSWYPMLSDLLLPLSLQTITKEEFDKSFYAVAKKDLVKNGAIYGIPTELDTLALYVNSDIFQSAGTKVPDNWEDFGNVARSLTVTDQTGKIKTSGAALGTFNNVMHAPDIISMLFAQNKADIYKLSENPKRASDTLTWYTDFASGDQRVWDETLSNSMQYFAGGNAAMYFGYSWDYFAIKASNPNLKIEIHPVPKLNNNGTTIASYWAAGVSTKSKYKEESLLFIKFLTSKETQQKLYTLESKTRLFGEPYARKDLADTLRDSVANVFVSQGDNATSSFFASDTYDGDKTGFNSQMNNYLEKAVSSILSQNNTSADTAVTTLSQGVSQILKQYGQ